jgi:putative SOS response-associated peptidase YedK
MPDHYLAVRDRASFMDRFGLVPPAGAAEVGIGHQGMFVRRPRADTIGNGPLPPLEVATGRWGLIPLFSKDGQDRLFEAPSETAATERNFYQPWKRGHRCVILASALFDPEGGDGASAVRIARADGRAFCIAGLWNGWRSPAGECVESFAMLTIDATEEALMRHLPAGRPRRRPVILPDAWVDDWLHAPVEETATFLRPYPLEVLVAEAVAHPAA